MSYLLYLGGCLLLALFWDPPWQRKPKVPPTILPPIQGHREKAREKFVHRGGYHNVYWTTGNRNRTRPWIRNIR